MTTHGDKTGAAGTTSIDERRWRRRRPAADHTTSVLLDAFRASADLSKWRLYRRIQKSLLENVHNGWPMEHTLASTVFRMQMCKHADSDFRIAKSVESCSLRRTQEPTLQQPHTWEVNRAKEDFGDQRREHVASRMSQSIVSCADDDERS